MGAIFLADPARSSGWTVKIALHAHEPHTQIVHVVPPAM